VESCDKQFETRLAHATTWQRASEKLNLTCDCWSLSSLKLSTPIDLGLSLVRHESEDHAIEGDGTGWRPRLEVERKIY
jgi:hypothetical protein